MIAIRVSKSGGWISARSPHSKRVLQPVLQGFDFLGRPVRGQNNLLFCLIKGIKGMEKLLLGLILTADKLNVIY